MTEISIELQAEKEKTNAALSSVVAAIGLTLFKIIVGLVTNSLGILAEAAHSGLDLVAALVTFLAVRVSGKPADEQHAFGHGKIENLSALFETFLLLLTCVWIIYELTQRLFVKSEPVDISFWAFLVMFVSIIIDYSRSRILYKAARKHNSQALEADALHFSTDIWSSSVVIIGLIGVSLAKVFPALRILDKADAISALAVALIVVYVSVELGKRTIDGLLDSAPDGLKLKIEQAAQEIPGVVDSHQVRVRTSGPNLFIDMHVLADPTLSLQAVHQLTEKIEATVHKVAPKADITVHVEPYHGPKEAPQITGEEAPPQVQEESRDHV